MSDRTEMMLKAILDRSHEQPTPSITIRTPVGANCAAKGLCQHNTGVVRGERLGTRSATTKNAVQNFTFDSSPQDQKKPMNGL